MVIPIDPEQGHVENRELTMVGSNYEKKTDHEWMEKERRSGEETEEEMGGSRLKKHSSGGAACSEHVHFQSPLSACFGLSDD